MDRAIAPNEAAVVRWLLDHAPVGGDCGCSSLDFQPDAWRDAHIVADTFAVYSDGQQAGVILWGREGEIVLLEIYDCHPGASRRFPEISNLRTFEERGPDG